MSKLPKRVRVHVRQTHIDRAVPNNCQLCIGAMAINDVVDATYCKVELNKVALNRRGSTHREVAILPREMNRALWLLDHKRRNEIKPFSFWITLMQTTKIMKPDRERQEIVNQQRRERNAKLRELGIPPKIYHKKPRTSGVQLKGIEAAG